MKADSLAMDFERIAVEHRDDAGHVGQGWGGKQAQGDGEGAHRYMMPRGDGKKSPPPQLSAASGFILFS